MTPLTTVSVLVPANGLIYSDANPDDPALCFLEIFLQAVELDPGAIGKLSFTPGLELVIGFDL
ncbi:MAG: hypothetical protein EXS13_04535 [Planctomycetes bacterium]|nr:hypothetical protein [Planctomycetota bacterium]